MNTNTMNTDTMKESGENTVEISFGTVIAVLLEQKETNITEVVVDVGENDYYDGAQIFKSKNNNNMIRGGVDEKNKVYIWGASDAIHGDVQDIINKEFTWKLEYNHRDKKLWIGEVTGENKKKINRKIKKLFNNVPIRWG